MTQAIMTQAISATRGGSSFKPGAILRDLAVLAVTLIWTLPLIGLLINSFRTTGDARLSGFWKVVQKPNFTGANYAQAMDQLGGLTTFAYTLLLTVPTTLITVAVSAVGAYALSRLTFRGGVAMTLLLIALLVVPTQLTLVPLLKTFSLLGIQGTLPAVWIVLAGQTVPYGILLVRGFMVAFPSEIVEAARIDGANEFRVFRQIILPDAMPILASLGILQFIWSWNALLEPLIFLGPASEFSSITVRLVSMKNAFGLGINLLTAGTFISILVPLLILISLQRYFVAGVTSSGVK
jgi:alpha-glucoside transport system permease protein